MKPSDLADLHERCFDTPRPWCAEEFLALLKDSSVFLLTVDTGFVLGRAASGEAELLTLAVDPDQRRRGAGTALLAAFEREARDRSSDTAFLEVSVANTAARALYEAAGYTESGLRPKYYRRADGIRVDAIVMAKSLAQS